MELPITLLAAPLLSFFIGTACARLRAQWWRMSAAVLLPVLAIPTVSWAVFIAPESGSRQQEQIAWAPIVVVPALGLGVLASVCGVRFSRAKPRVWKGSSRS